MDGKDVCCVEKAKWGGVEDHVNLQFYKEHFIFTKKISQTTFWPSKYNVKLFFLLEMDGGIVGFLVLTH